MFFYEVFLKVHEKKLLIFKNGQNCVFGAFSKILNKITIVCLLFLKLNQSRNMNKIFLKNQKLAFSRVKIK